MSVAVIADIIGSRTLPDRTEAQRVLDDRSELPHTVRQEIHDELQRRADELFAQAKYYEPPD